MSSWQGQWQRHATRLGVALSLLLHAAALLVYLVLAEPPASLPPQRSFLVELVGPVTTSPLASTGPPASHGSAGPPPPPGPSAAGPGARAGQGSPAPSPALPVATPATPSEVASPSPQSWFEANGLGAALETRPNGPTDLTARAPAALGAPGGGTGERDGSGQAATTANRVGRLLRQASGKARVRSSHDPAWSPLSDRLRANFQPDWSVLEHGPQPKGLASTGLARMFPGYLEMAERFASSERLSDADGVMGERTSEAGKVVDRLVAAGSHSTSGLSAPVGPLENHFQRTFLTLVEVAHRDDGSVADIRLRQQSGNAAIDRLALAATRRAVAESDPAAWAGKGRTSVWAFTTVLGIVPPAPALGCPPDVLWTGRFDRCAYPLKKLSEAKVELEAIE
jgi:hypothetical protein